MNFIAGKHLSRRALLRGAGARHRAAGPRRHAARLCRHRRSTVRRIGVVYVPNGIIMNQWTPAASGADFAFTRILKPLEPFRDDDHRDLRPGQSTPPSKAQGGGHAKASGSFLSGCPPKLHRRRRRSRRHHLRPGGRAEMGRRDARAVAAARLRRLAHGRQLRHRFELRLHQQPLLERSRHAARRRGESALGVRTAVRHGRSEPRLRRPARAARCTAAASSISRARARAASIRTSARPTAARWTST